MVSELLHSPLGEVFDYQQLITDVSGSGNNWLAGVHWGEGGGGCMTLDRPLDLILPVNLSK